jgi:hypothetical protein
MILEVTTYLRDVAQACIRLARACPDPVTSRELEELAVDLMAKAEEFQRFYDE